MSRAYRACMRVFCRLSGFAGALVAAACLTGPATAAAQGGNLRFDGCIAGAASNVPCHRHAAGLQAPRDIAVSPDGRDVYVASIDGDVARLHRNQATGRLAPRGCLADVNADPAFTKCSREAPGLFEASAIATSPDGKSVYVGGPETISEFSRGAHGRLKFVACAADDPQDAGDTAGEGCTLTRDGIGGHSLAVGPDGRFVYAASDTNSSITEFARDQGSGELSFSQCAVASDVPAQEPQPTASCGISSPALFDVADIAVSSDGAGLYGVSAEDEHFGYGARALFLLPRDAGTGKIASVSCLYGSVSPDCAAKPYPGAPTSLALSPDGDSAYTSTTCCESGANDAVSSFQRDASTGGLAFAGCLAGPDYPADDCSKQQGVTRGDLAVAPDGRSVYVAGHGQALDVFRTGDDGTLDLAGCIGLRGDDTYGCGRSAKALPSRVAVSPDGRFVYGADDDSVSVFHRNTHFHGRHAPR